MRSHHGHVWYCSFSHVAQGLKCGFPVARARSRHLRKDIGVWGNEVAAQDQHALKSPFANLRLRVLQQMRQLLGHKGGLIFSSPTNQAAFHLELVQLVLLSRHRRLARFLLHLLDGQHGGRHARGPAQRRLFVLEEPQHRGHRLLGRLEVRKLPQGLQRQLPHRQGLEVLQASRKREDPGFADPSQGLEASLPHSFVLVTHCHRCDGSRQLRGIFTHASQSFHGSSTQCDCWLLQQRTQG
mmetsp:Transcript_12912/g.30681  ORF Transcript_12912/g.30681 Transcript_12912/m.30681 type:complete len:240 (+) Transcript_12912:899-1618(+)